MSYIKIDIENSGTETKQISISEILANVQNDKDICYAFRMGDQKQLDKMKWTKIRIHSASDFWKRRKERINFKDRKTGKLFQYAIEHFWQQGQMQTTVLDIFAYKLTLVKSLEDYEILFPIAGQDFLSVVFMDDPIPENVIKPPAPSTSHEEKYEGKELEIKFAGNNDWHPFSVRLLKSSNAYWHFPEFNKEGISIVLPLRLNCEWENFHGAPLHTKRLNITILSRDGNEIIFKHRDFNQYDRQFFEALWNTIVFTFDRDDGKPFSFYAKKQKP